MEFHGRPQNPAIFPSQLTPPGKSGTMRTILKNQCQPTPSGQPAFRSLELSLNTAAASDPLATLYRNHHGWLQGWLRRRLGCAVEAADLAQDAFVRLLRSPQRFDSQPEARAYLRVVANGLCVDLWRHREVERAWLDTLAVLPEAQAPSPEDQLIVLQALREIDSMLRSLPPRAARAFVLATACGMTYQEIAGELGVSSRTVGTYITQAMLHCMHLEAASLVEQGGEPI